MKAMVPFLLCLAGAQTRINHTQSLKGAGDLARFVLQCVTNRESHATTNSVTAIEAT
jgi:hypothetical protein